MTEPDPVSEDFLPRIARGDGEAVSACLKKYTPLVWSLARRYCRDAAIAEDVVQEVFIDVWRSAERFDPDKASETTFIAMIARRRMIDRQRKIARTPRAEDVEEVVIGTVDTELEKVELGDEARLAREVLEKLRPEQRRVILMSVVDGMTHPEIAADTGLALGTVKSHIRRGLDKVAQIVASRSGESA